MGLSPHRRPTSRHRSGSRSRRIARFLFERLEDRLALAATPAFSISDVTLVEGNAGATAATFTVSLSKASNKPALRELCNAERNRDRGGGL